MKQSLSAVLLGAIVGSLLLKFLSPPSAAPDDQQAVAHLPSHGQEQVGEALLLEPDSEAQPVSHPSEEAVADEPDSSDSSDSTSESKPKKPKWARFPPSYQPPDDSFFEARYADQGLEELQAAFDQVIAVISEEAGRRLEEDYANGVYEELDAERVEYEPGQFGYQSPPRDPRYLSRTGSKRGDISKVHVTSLDPSLHQDLYDMRAECFWIRKRMSELGANLGGAPQWVPAPTGSK